MKKTAKTAKRFTFEIKDADYIVIHTFPVVGVGRDEQAQRRDARAQARRFFKNLKLAYKD